MTLSEIKARLNQHSLQAPALSDLGGNRWRVSGLNTLRTEVLALTDIPGLETVIQPIVRHAAFSFLGDMTTMQPSDAADLQRSVQNAVLTIDGLRQYLNQSTPELTVNAIRVKLPDSHDYRGVVSDQQALLAALEQLLLLNPNLAATIKIDGWENGSLWLILCVGTPLAVELIGRAVWAAAVIRKKIYEGSIARENARRFEVENDFIEHLNAKAKQAVDALVETEALAVYDQYFSGERKPEEIERLKHTLESLAKLIGRGAEIHPALMAPEKAANLFPDFKSLDTVTSQIRQLEQGTEPPVS